MKNGKCKERSGGRRKRHHRLAIHEGSLNCVTTSEQRVDSNSAGEGYDEHWRDSIDEEVLRDYIEHTSDLDVVVASEERCSENEHESEDNTEKIAVHNALTSFAKIDIDCEGLYESGSEDEPSSSEDSDTTDIDITDLEYDDEGEEEEEEELDGKNDQCRQEKKVAVGELWPVLMNDTRSNNTIKKQKKKYDETESWSGRGVNKIVRENRKWMGTGDKKKLKKMRREILRY